MREVVYICTGTCQAQISERQHKEGLVVCGAKDCTMKGKPFKKISKVRQGK